MTVSAMTDFLKGPQVDKETSHSQFWGSVVPGCSARRTGIACACVDWAARSTYRTAWAVPPRCRSSYSCGSGPALGPQTKGCSWELLRGLWRAVAPIMTPWCSEGDVPTSANLNFHGGWRSRVRWHSDDVALLADRGDPKLNVSLSLGSSALFKRKPRSRADGEERSCWLHHGDLLVMDGCCQDEYLHCTDPRLGGERVKVTFRWIRNHLHHVPTRCWSGVLPAHVRSELTRSRRRGLSLVAAFSCGACSGPVGRGLAAGCEAPLCRIWSAGAFLFLAAFFGCGAGQISCPSSWVERRRDKCWAGFVGVLHMVELFARYARPRGVDCPVSLAMTRVCWLNPAGHTGATTGKSIMRPTFSPLAFSLRVEPLLQDFLGRCCGISGFVGQARTILTVLSLM